MEVAILGVGFSGIAVAARLSRMGIRPTVFDFGSLGGRAYASNDPLHLLNVPAARMSLWEDDDEDLLRWAECSPEEFLPRARYRQYLESAFRQSGAELIPLRVESIARKGTRWGTPAGLFEHVVLATGYGPPPALDPYRTENWPDTASRVLIAGTGLTAADAAVTVGARYPGAEIVCVSPRARFPEPYVHADPIALGEPPGSFRALARWVRQRVAEFGYAAVYEALRGRWQSLYVGLDSHEQAQFRRHLASWHDLYRHRLPPPTAQRLRDLGGRLRLLPGRIRHLEADRGILGDGSQIGAQLVLDARGHSNSLGPWVGAERIRFDADGQGRLSGYERLWCLGPSRREQLWETTAVREIRLQATQIVKAIVAGEGR